MLYPFSRGTGPKTLTPSLPHSPNSRPSSPSTLCPLKFPESKPKEPPVLPGDQDSLLLLDSSPPPYAQPPTPRSEAPTSPSAPSAPSPDSTGAEGQPLASPPLAITTVGGTSGVQLTGLSDRGREGFKQARNPKGKGGKDPSKTSWVQGATGGKLYRWTTEQKVHLSTGQVTHSFLLVPDCPYPLLGRDLLSKVGAQIHFQQKGATITGAEGQPLQVLPLRLEDEHRLHEDSPPSVQPLDSEWLTNYPQAWVETAGMGLAVNQPPIIINLKPSATPISIRQYSMSKEAKEGIRPHIQRLLQLGILIPCQSPWNTPLLPVKPGTGDYRPVQDLREVNWRTEDIHPTVPNPYNLLSTLPPSHVWYTVLDLKDAFFCLRLSSQSQPIFAFEWKDPETGFSGQLTWTRLPQGFKNSPTLFDEALHRDLADFRVGHPDLVLLQYVDDLLLAARTEQDCVKGTGALLERLGELGYRASAKKAQIVMHDCHQILAEVHGTRGDLTDQPLPDAEATWYTDGSSFLRNGERKAGAAVVDGKAVIWASALEPGTSAQRAELIALTQALRKAKDKKVNIYTDSRYAFAMPMFMEKYTVEGVS
ncbi:unnamed protein product [Nyctereutes procyonoides]|uniref:(raccoon dog) hypothetical protein n=1 Tax=Nyctereutes procyonoides TaxID=34880 RepID=A0A811Y6W1_NYCPR|nr:unnamed protein product [Nyctereutes procyonoides]